MAPNRLTGRCAGPEDCQPGSTSGPSQKADSDDDGDVQLHPRFYQPKPQQKPQLPQTPEASQSPKTSQSPKASQSPKTPEPSQTPEPSLPPEGQGPQFEE